MWSILKPIIARYLPVAGRYVATAAVGVLAASLNRVSIQLDPNSTAELTAGLGGVFIALAGWALNGTAKQAGDTNIANAVRASGNADSAPIAVEDKKTGEVHTISAVTSPQPPLSHHIGPVGRAGG